MLNEHPGRVFGVSTGRQWQQGPQNGQRAFRRRTERRIGSLKVRRHRLRSFAPKLSIINSRMEKEPRESKAFHLGEKVAWTKSGEWTLSMRSRAERSWMSKGKSCRKICGTLKNSRVCRKRFRKAPKMTCSSSCRRWRKGGMTSCQSIKKCRQDHIIYKVGSGSREVLNSRLCAKCSSEESRPLLSNCHGHRKEEETVKMNESEAELVSSWCYQRQAGSVKALQRAVWSLIFLVFGVCRAKVEEPEIQAQKMSEKDFYPNHRVDVRWKGMLSWITCEWKWMKESSWYRPG